MEQTKRKLLAILLCLILLGSIMSTKVFAMEPDVTVATLEELQNAISSAQSGGTIYITQTIYVRGPVSIGDPNKIVTLKGRYGAGTFLSFEGSLDYSNTMSLTNVIIDGSDTLSGPKVSISTDATCNFKDVTWLNCASEMDGGAIYRIGNGMLYLNNCAFQNCSADRGGAIFNGGPNSCAFVDCSFIGNSANLGGAIYDMGYFTTTRCTFSRNVSVMQGGAIYSDGVNLSESIFSDNQAQMGGAIYCTLDSCSVSQCQFRGNQAVQGGAVYSEAAAQIMDTTVSGNVADIGGGVFLQSNATVSNSKIFDNSASQYADDLFGIGTVYIDTSNDRSIFAGELQNGGFDSLGWCVDSQNNRFSPDSRVEATFDEYGQLTAPSIHFAMWKEEQPPETQPTTEPTTEPTIEPGTEPETEPTTGPTTEPTTEPTIEPETEPTIGPGTEPSTEPTIEESQLGPSTNDDSQSGSKADPVIIQVPTVVTVQVPVPSYQQPAVPNAVEKKTEETTVPTETQATLEPTTIDEIMPTIPDDVGDLMVEAETGQKNPFSLMMEFLIELMQLLVSFFSWMMSVN